MLSILKDICSVLKKNILIDFKSPFSLFSQFLISCLVCLIIYLSHSSRTFTVNIFKQLLPFYLGNLTTSLIRKFSLFFIREREQRFGKYQRAMGLTVTGYVFGNLFYCYILTVLVVLPPILFLLYYNPSVTIITGFVAYFLASTSFFLMIVTFFKDPKLCSQVVTLVCGLSALLYYIVDVKDPGVVGYLVMVFPPPCFVMQVLDGSKKALSIMLLTTKIYFVMFLYRQFQIHPLQKCQKCIKWYKNRFGQGVNNQQQIQQEQVQQAIVFEKQSVIKQSLLKIRNVYKYYDQELVLDNLSLTIKKGQILTILGRNGAGKTTLMNIFSQIQKPSQGTIQYLQNDLQLGLCFQQQTLYQQLTIIQMLQFHLNIRKAQSDNLTSILSLIPLNQSYLKPIFTLSGGTKRKLSLIISLLGDPSLLLYDEPTSGLDTFSRRQIWNILIKLKQQGKSIVITTHHMDQAETVSDRICIMENGRLLVVGSPLFIRKRFGMEGERAGYCVGVMVALEVGRKVVEEIVERYGGEVEIKRCQSKRLGSWKYTLKCEQSLLVPLLKQLQSYHYLSSTIQLNSLEDSFISIIQPSFKQSQLHHSNHEPSDPLPLSPQPLLASFLKTFYLLKRRPFKYFILYNLNLLFLLFSDILLQTLSYYHSSLIQSIISTNIQTAFKILLLIQGYIFSIGVYIYTPVYQRQKHIIDLLKVRGMDCISYWLPQFLIDYSLFIINSIIAYFYMGGIINFFYLISFGASLIIFSYCCGYLFKSSSNAIRYFPVVNFVFGLVTPFIELIKWIGCRFILKNVFILVYPFSSLQDYVIGTMQVGGRSESWFMLLYPYIFQISLYTCIILCIQMKVYSRLKSWILKYPTQHIPQPIKFNNICKKYSLFNQQALSDISFWFPANQSMGIIGPNGAGKSTIYKILTNQQSPTSGQLYLQFQHHYPYTPFTKSSVCYQQDTLWQTLTPREILRIFKYVSGSNQEENEYEIKLGEDILIKQFQKLSGGNKRKVCMEACLIGDPQLVYLDECSTGLDPLTRRMMLKKQNILKRKGGCLVFTSHCLQDVERVCDNVFIIFDGKGHSYDNIQSLKQSYCWYYYVNIIHNNIETDRVDEVRSRMEEIGKEDREKKRGDKGKSTWKVKRMQVKGSQMLERLMEMKREGLFKQFVVYLPTLEDAYYKVKELRDNGVINND